jgi:hypothetical protein
LISRSIVFGIHRAVHHQDQIPACVHVGNRESDQNIVLSIWIGNLAIKNLGKLGGWDPIICQISLSSLPIQILVGILGWIDGMYCRIESLSGDLLH